MVSAMLLSRVLRGGNHSCDPGCMFFTLLQTPPIDGHGCSIVVWSWPGGGAGGGGGGGGGGRPRRHHHHHHRSCGGGLVGSGCCRIRKCFYGSGESHVLTSKARVCFVF